MVKVVKLVAARWQSAEQFAKVGDIIRADESRKYVVPSAPGKRNSKDNQGYGYVICMLRKSRGRRGVPCSSHEDQRAL